MTSETTAPPSFDVLYEEMEIMRNEMNHLRANQQPPPSTSTIVPDIKPDVGDMSAGRGYKPSYKLDPPKFLGDRGDSSALLASEYLRDLSH